MQRSLPRHFVFLSCGSLVGLHCWEPIGSVLVVTSGAAGGGPSSVARTTYMACDQTRSAAGRAPTGKPLPVMLRVASLSAKLLGQAAVAVDALGHPVQAPLGRRDVTGARRSTNQATPSARARRHPRSRCPSGTGGCPPQGPARPRCARTVSTNARLVGGDNVERLAQPQQGGVDLLAVVGLGEAAHPSALVKDGGLKRSPPARPARGRRAWRRRRCKPASHAPERRRVDRVTRLLPDVVTGRRAEARPGSGPTLSTDGASRDGRAFSPLLSRCSLERP